MDAAEAIFSIEFRECYSGVELMRYFIKCEYLVVLSDDCLVQIMRI